MYIKIDVNGEYGFYTPDVHGGEFCKNECIEITNEFYEFLMQNSGEYLVDVNSVNGTVTKDNLIKRLIEETEKDTTPSQEERLQALESAMLDLVLGGMV